MELIWSSSSSGSSINRYKLLRLRFFTRGILIGYQWFRRNLQPNLDVLNLEHQQPHPISIMSSALILSASTCKMAYILTIAF
ncbi:hypothetical protein LXL04_033314 [Taraxacum kok-saghyz]